MVPAKHRSFVDCRLYTSRVINNLMPVLLTIYKNIDLAKLNFEKPSQLAYRFFSGLLLEIFENEK